MKIPRNPLAIAESARKFTENAVREVLFWSGAAPGFYNSVTRSTFDARGHVTRVRDAVTGAVGNILSHVALTPTDEHPDAPRFSVDVSGGIHGGTSWTEVLLTFRVSNTADEKLRRLSGRTFLVEWDPDEGKFYVEEY